ncbi:MAG: 2-keto-4-pentenoate hydratase [Paracoccaceae bacterium]
MNAHKSAEALLGYRDTAKAASAADWLASGLAPGTEAEAYAIQAAMADIMEGRGATQIGYKIGATNQAARNMLGVDGPLYGRLWQDQASDAPTGEASARIAFVPTLHKVAEAEVALRMGRDVDASDGPVTAETIRAAVADVIPVVEIAGTSLDPWLEAGGLTLTADNGIHALWIKGAAKPDWDGFDPLELPVTVTRTKGEPHVGKGGAVDGGAFAAAAWLANKLAEHGKSLREGDYISTGSATVPIPVVAGDTLNCDFGPLGSLAVRISG